MQALATASATGLRWARTARLAQTSSGILGPFRSSILIHLLTAHVARFVSRIVHAFTPYTDIHSTALAKGQQGGISQTNPGDVPTPLARRGATWLTW